MCARECARYRLSNEWRQEKQADGKGKGKEKVEVEVSNVPVEVAECDSDIEVLEMNLESNKPANPSNPEGSPIALTLIISRPFHSHHQHFEPQHTVISTIISVSSISLDPAMQHTVQIIVYVCGREYQPPLQGGTSSVFACSSLRA